MIYLVKIAIALHVLHQAFGQNCNPWSGPSGSAVCVKLDDYNKYQWATCLTRRYIETFSRDEHTCRETALGVAPIYCFYQCMLEVNGQEKGIVTDDCACGSDAVTGKTTQRPTTTVSLPLWCASPTGTECSWYRSCLQKKNACSTWNTYYVKLAENICNLYAKYETSNMEFHNTTLEWLDAARVCMLIWLVPLIRPFDQKTCDQVEQAVAETYNSCFRNPREGAPSLCDITSSDWWLMFWALKKDFIFDEPIDALQKLITIKEMCGKMLVSAEKVRVMRFTVYAPFSSNPKIRNSIAEVLLRKVIAKMDWNGKRDLLSYVYPLDSNIENTFSVHILVAPKDRSEAVNLSFVVESLYNVLKDGRLQLLLTDGYRVTAFTECDGLPCTPLGNKELALPTPKGTVSCSVTDDPDEPIFAENVCYFYTSHLAKFSTGGKRWLDQLKTCLQTNMAPILMDFDNKSCSEIKDANFDIHPSCCVNTNSLNDSVCNLDRREWWQIFWTVVGASNNAPAGMHGGLISTASSCSNLTPDSNTMKLIKFEIRSLNTVSEGLMNSAAKGVLAALSQKMQWSKDVSAISYTSKFDLKLRKRSTSNNDMGFNINVLIAQKAEYDLNTDNAVADYNLTVAVEGVLNAIQNKTLKLDIRNGLTVTKVLSCTDTACSSVDQQIDVPTSDAVSGQCSFFFVGMAIYICHLVMVNHF